jgi:hypothetical protein
MKIFTPGTRAARWRSLFSRARLRTSIIPLGLMLGLFSSSAAWAQAPGAPPPRVQPRQSPGSELGLDAWDEAEANAYCRQVLSDADSQSSLLYSPRVISSLNLLNGSSFDPESGASADRDLVLNFRAGIEVSPTRMHAATLLRDQARADCEQRRAALALQALPVALSDDGPALAAQAEVLRGALGMAQEILAASHAKLDASLTTVQAYTATRLRVDAHKKLLAEVDAQIARLPPLPSEQPSPKKVFDALRSSENQRQAVDRSRRRSESVDVTLRGGYSELFAVPQTLPIFAQLNVGFTPGWFWQEKAEEQSAAARRDWVENRIERARAALRDGADRLARQLDVARRQLEEASVSLADLEQRYAQLRGVRTAYAEELMEFLWFELVRLRAEQAYAQTQVQTLEERRRSIEASLR